MVRSLRASLDQYQDPYVQAQIKKMLAEGATSNSVQGFANVFKKVFAGYMGGKDTKQRKEAQKTYATAMATPYSPAQTAVPYSDFNASELEGEEGPDMEFYSDGTSKEIPSLPEGGNIIEAKEEDGPFIAAQRELNKFEDNPYASGLSADIGMQNALGARRLAQTLAEDNRKASRKLADLKNMHLFKQDNPLTASSRPASPIQNDIYRQKLVSEFGADSTRVRQFDSFVRANTTLNLGDRQVITSGTGGTPIRSFTVKPKPGEMPFFKAAQERAIKLAAYEIEKTKDLPSAIEAFDGKRDQEALLVQINRQVQDIVSRGTTGGTGGAVKGLLPESDQYELNEQIKTFEAAIGLDALIAAKAKGATFGALTKNEMDLLIATAGSLNTLRGPVKVGQAVQRALNMFSQAQRRSEQSFYKKYGTGAHTPISFVRNDADFNNIKKGQQFYDPNGQLRRKP